MATNVGKFFRRVAFALASWQIFTPLTASAAPCATRFAEGVASEDPSRWSEREHFERSVQYLIRPILRGVGYDVPGRRVFFSACRRRQYECDLYSVNLDGPANQEAIVFRSSRQYGYEWPSVSFDGAHLVAVRTLRLERPSQRNVHHQLVQIDLTTNEERVIAEAGDGRFDRVLFVGEDALLVVRSYRSSPAVRCRGDYCTDVAELFTLYGGERRGTTVTARAEGMGGGRVDITPLGPSAPLWWITLFPLGGGPNSDSPLEYRLDPASGQFQDISPTVSAEQGFLAAVERLLGSLGGWRATDLTHGGGGPRQLTPFCGSHAANIDEAQSVLVNARHGAYVFKRIREPEVTHAFVLEIVALENRGPIPWQSVASIDATLPD